MPIAEESRPCWLITCDYCEEGDDSEYGGHRHHASERDARRAVYDANWHTVADGRLICGSCREDAIPDLVACPRCAADVGDACRDPEGWVPTCSERMEEWALANPPEPRPEATR